MNPLFPALREPSDKVALRFATDTLNYRQLAGAVTALAERLRGANRVALWATPTLHTAVGAIAGLCAGVPVVPINPKSGEAELDHIVTDSAPSHVLTTADTTLPPALARLERHDIDLRAATTEPLPGEPDPEDPALIIYTSGTTGPPKGAVLSRRAISSNLDALYEAWHWSSDDTVVHGLPLFHVHGLVLGVFGPVRRGGSLRHVGRFSTDTVTQALRDGGTMLFAVPTMYHRIAQEVAEDPRLTAALSKARLLVSGSAPLTAPDQRAISAATGKRVVERYGMSETLMNTGVRVDATAPFGSVGVPFAGVRLRLVDDNDEVITARDGATIGEIQVRGDNLFTEYLNRPEATAEAFDGAWFRTGDMATMDNDGNVTIVGRKSTDLIKSGGYKIGAGEIENALLDHPQVAEAAVTGESDPDLGEKVIAWVVAADVQKPPEATVLIDHVAAALAPHKRPREVRLLDQLPRNAMGKLMKKALHE